MAREKMDFAQQNTERAMQGTEWMRAIAEQNLNQSKAALEEFLTISRNAVRGVDLRHRRRPLSTAVVRPHLQPYAWGL